MRIISGKYKGRLIYPPKNFSARPTTDKAKESLFNIIQNNFDIEETRFLDLFAGTGSISYEMISRGCKQVELIEDNPRHYRFIQKTIKELNLENIHPVKADVFGFIRHCERKYDLIFADPPFDMSHAERIPEMIFEYRLLYPNGWFIMEHGPDKDFTGNPHLLEIKKYGKVHFTIFTEEK